jgi:hypothetical protein
LDFEREMMVFAHSRPVHFTKCRQVTAHDFPLNSLQSVSFAAVLKGLGKRPNQASLNYLFHLPFSGSTLLSKYLEEWAFVIRDPAFLHSLYLPKLAAPLFPDEIARLRTAALQLLGRRFEDRKTVVRVGGYWPAMIRPLVRSPTFRAAVFLYVKPGQFLAQVLKRPSRRRDMRDLLAARKSYVRLKTGETLERLTDADVALLFWHLSIENVLANSGGDKTIRTLDCDAFLKRRHRYLDFVCRLFEIAADQTMHGKKLAHLQTHHSKERRAFDYQHRRRDLASASSIYGGEIASALSAAGRWNVSTPELLRRLRQLHI